MKRKRRKRHKCKACTNDGERVRFFRESLAWDLLTLETACWPAPWRSSCGCAWFACRAFRWPKVAGPLPTAETLRGRGRHEAGHRRTPGAWEGERVKT